MSLKIVALRRCCENIGPDHMSLNDNYLASAKRVSQAEGREFEPRLPLSVKSTAANQRQSCLEAVFVGKGLHIVCQKVGGRVIIAHLGHRTHPQAPTVWTIFLSLLFWLNS